MLNRDAQRLRAAQVGMLMRAYRESYPAEEGRRGLTQDELLRRMADVDDRYGERYSHTTVSRWESGATRPNRQRIEAFGKALELSETEIRGLIALAGMDVEPNTEERFQDIEPDEQTGYPVAEGQTDLIEPGSGGDSRANPRTFARNIHPFVRQVIYTMLLPGLVIMAVGYLLVALGWNDTWMAVVYVALVMAVRVSAGYLSLNSPHDLCELLSGSVFVLLTAPLLQGALIGLDQYGFYALLGLSNAPLHFMMALMVNLGVSMAAGLMSFGLWKWQYTRWGAGTSARRAVSVILPPLAFVYATMAVIANIGVLIQLGLVLSVLAAVCIILLSLRDPAIDMGQRDRQFVLWATLTVALVTTTFAAGIVVIMYSSDGGVMNLPNHNLLFSWEIDFETLGMTRQEAVEMFNIGYLWQGVFVFIYLVFFLSGHLIASIYRADGDGRGGSVPSARGGDPATTGSGSNGPDTNRGELFSIFASLTRRRTDSISD